MFCIAGQTQNVTNTRKMVAPESLVSSLKVIFKDCDKSHAFAAALS
jgi:hypothetical protein